MDVIYTTSGQHTSFDPDLVNRLLTKQYEKLERAQARLETRRVHLDRMRSNVEAEFVRRRGGAA